MFYWSRKHFEKKEERKEEMKKIFEIIIKVILFFLLWLIGVGVVPVPNIENPAMWRFAAELMPLLVIYFITVIFLFIEKRKISLQLTDNWMKGMIIGSICGIIWLVIPVLIMYVGKMIRFEGINHIPLWGVWLVSVLLNVIMQELLVRGYLYQMIKQKSNIIVATLVTTGIFTLLHGGAFESGVIPVLNVLTMSLLMTVLLEWTKSLWVPIMAHFMWNAIGALVLNGVSLAEDYPHLFITAFTGNDIFSGGQCKLEGSIVVLVVNMFFVTYILYLWRKKQNR